MSQCSEVAKKTIEFAYYLNSSVHKELVDLSKVLTNFSENINEMPVRLKNLGVTMKAVERCWRNQKSMIKNYNRCRQYC